MVEPPPLRVVFFGTPEFAVPTLDRLLASRHQVVGVVTQPDRPRGRGQKITDAPVKARALEAQLPVLQPDRLNVPEVLHTIELLAADIGVVAAYGKILPETLLRIPRLGMINVHASLLPRWRGAAPVHRAVMAGDAETGVTIMRVVKALDAGPMLSTVRRPIEAHDTSQSLEQDLAVLGGALLVETLERLAAGPLEEVPQDERAVTYASRLTKDDAPVDWSRPAAAIHNQIRGLVPWPHAHAHLRGRRIILLRSEVAGTTAGPPATPGSVVDAHGDGIAIATGDGLLLVRDLQVEGKRAMPARDFLAGHHLRPGDRFTSQP